MLRSDLRAKRALYSRYGATVGFWNVFLADGTLANILFRLMGVMAGWRLWPAALLLHWANKWINGCVIGVNCRFGPGFVLIHPIGVVINSRVRGGANVWLESGVVIGENRGLCPQLGSDIFIGSGAKVIGGITIGSGARIGANAVVLHDVAPGVSVGGIPARPLKRSEP